MNTIYRKATTDKVVPLKVIAAKVGIEPKVARRILREGGKKPQGRWEWDSKIAPEVQKLLKASAS